MGRHESDKRAEDNGYRGKRRAAEQDVVTPAEYDRTLERALREEAERRAADRPQGW